MGMEPAVDSVSPLEAQFSIEGVDTSQGLPPSLGDSRAVFGVDVRETSGADGLVAGLSRIFRPLWTEIVAGAVRKARPDRERKRFDQFAKPAFAGDQRLILASRADVRQALGSQNLAHDAAPDQPVIRQRPAVGGAEPLAATTRPSALHCTTLKDCW